MKKSFSLLLILLTSVCISGSGYKGTLPDLSIKEVNLESAKPKKNPKNNILPLDKLTIPSRQVVPVDKELDLYKEYMTNIFMQMDRLHEILSGDKSFKNYVASANVFDLTSNNVISKFKSERFYSANIALDNINHDVQQIKNYWIKINKNAPYVSYYTTQGAYSGAVLNEQLNNFAKVLEYAKRDITKKTEEIK